MYEEDDVTVETPNDTVEETEETPEETEEVAETPEVDTDQLQATNKKLFERAKKAEAELRTLKGSKSEVSKPASPQLSVEETVLLAQGMDESLLGELKVIAQVRGTTLLKAQNDPIFTAVKEKFDKEQKVKSANVGSSRGAGTVKARKDFATPGLSKEEHMKMVKDTL